MDSIPHKTCTRCGQSKSVTEFYKRARSHDGLQAQCKDCKRSPEAREQQREAARRYNQTEKGKLKNREKARRNFHDNPKTREYLITYEKKRRKRDPEFAQKSREYRREFTREWKKKHPDIAKESERKQHERIANTPEIRAKYTEYQRNYRQERQKTDPAYHQHLMELAKSGQSRRRTRLNNGGGSHTATEWRKLCAAYNHCCVCCGQQKPLTEDHIIPVINGGSDNIDNIQPLCDTCNKRKGAKTIDYRY